MLLRIRELGAGLALDDFGTGHSSLLICSAFPRHHQNRSVFVRMTAKGKRPVILRSIIGLAHDLGMEVVAEGAETIRTRSSFISSAANTGRDSPSRADDGGGCHEVAAGRSDGDGALVSPKRAQLRLQHADIDPDLRKALTYF